MDVSVIIVNYNTLEMTKNTIDSVIEKTEGLNYEIILVDNASTDGSVDFFNKEYKNKIDFIRNDENLGFGKANNEGIKVANGKYIFLLNSDTLLINNAIKIFFDYMEENSNVGVCGGNIYSKDLEPTHSFAELPTLKSEINKNFDSFRKILRKNKKRKDFNFSDKELAVGYITGADMFIRKSVLEKVGVFDKDFFMYSEESELTFRIKKAGYKIISIPKAKIIHLEGKSTTFKEQRYHMYLDGKYKYFYKITDLKSCKYLYYILLCEYFFKFLVSKDKNYLKACKINREEYHKFLQNYKNLRKDY